MDPTAFERATTIGWKAQYEWDATPGSQIPDRDDTRHAQPHTCYPHENSRTMQSSWNIHTYISYPCRFITCASKPGKERWHGAIGLRSPSS